MKEFINNFFKDAEVNVPKRCKAAFFRDFARGVNPEWYKNNDQYEVIFQKDGLEHIAIFDNEGGLVKYKYYLDKGLLPTFIRTSLEKDYEIMNVVQINGKNQLSYEVIIRSEQLKRYLIMVDQSGEIIEKKSL